MGGGREGDRGGRGKSWGGLSGWKIREGDMKEERGGERYII